MLATLGLAFLGGLAGSAHCAAMCGGFAIALQGAGSAGGTPRVLYHLGRVNTYVGLGAGAGALGVAWLTSGPLLVMERTLALAAGLVMMWVGLEVVGLAPRLTRTGMSAIHETLARLLGEAARTSTPWAPLALGVLNAFLPCHLLLAALGLAAASGSVPAGAMIMLGFGCGTVPALLTVGRLGDRIVRAASGAASPVVAGLFVATGAVTAARAFMALCAHTS